MAVAPKTPANDAVSRRLVVTLTVAPHPDATALRAAVERAFVDVLERRTGRRWAAATDPGATTKEVRR
jgi:hypothetical protein